jgi:two-component sensor histidine kinase
MLVLPLRAQRDVFGAFQLATVEPDCFTDVDMALLEPIVVTTAMVIQNARLYEQAIHNADIQTQLLKEINHRVRSNLSVIVGLLYTERQREISDQQTYITAMNELIGRIQSIAIVHNMLSASFWQPLRLDELIRQVAQSSLRMLPRDKHFPLHITPSTVEITSEHAHSLALIINALLVNSIKHRTCASECGVQFDIMPAAPAGFVNVQFIEHGFDATNKIQEISNRNAELTFVGALARENLGGNVHIPSDPHVPITINFRNSIGAP